MSTAEVFADSVSKFYGGTSGVAAVRNVSVSLAHGERVAVVGKSGSGKSTLLNLLAGLDQPSEGRLVVAGCALHDLTSNAMARYRLETVGVVFQAFQLIPQRTALENVELPLILAGKPRRERVERAKQWLCRVGLEHRFHHHPYELSGGEQQRVAIARALVNEPRIVLADEPTGNLDSVTAGEIVHLLTQLCDDTQATFILVTHDIELAHRICNRQLGMSDGQLEELVA